MAYTCFLLSEFLMTDASQKSVHDCCQILASTFVEVCESLEIVYNPTLPLSDVSMDDVDSYNNGGVGNDDDHEYELLQTLHSDALQLNAADENCEDDTNWFFDDTADDTTIDIIAPPSNITINIQPPSTINMNHLSTDEETQSHHNWDKMEYVVASTQHDKDSRIINDIKCNSKSDRESDSKSDSDRMATLLIALIGASISFCSFSIVTFYLL